MEGTHVWVSIFRFINRSICHKIQSRCQFVVFHTRHACWSLYVWRGATVSQTKANNQVLERRHLPKLKAYLSFLGEKLIPTRMFRIFQRLDQYVHYWHQIIFFCIQRSISMILNEDTSYSCFAWVSIASFLNKMVFIFTIFLLAGILIFVSAICKR